MKIKHVTILTAATSIMLSVMSPSMASSAMNEQLASQISIKTVTQYPVTSFTDTKKSVLSKLSSQSPSFTCCSKVQDGKIKKGAWVGGRPGRVNCVLGLKCG